MLQSNILETTARLNNIIYKIRAIVVTLKKYNDLTSLTELTATQKNTILGGINLSETESLLASAKEAFNATEEIKT